MEDMTAKMRCWNPIFYGRLSYILGYATNGNMLKIVAIDNHLVVHEIMKFRHDRSSKAEVIKAFFSMSFLLGKISTMSNYMQPTRLMPFMSDNNGKRTLMLLDDRIQRTIKKEECADDDFARLADIFTVLQQLNDTCNDTTYLQTVKNLDIKRRRLSISLQPLGFERKPRSEWEVRVWLKQILIALKYWHGCGYCHGDLNWRNIVNVPSDPGHCLLIDMDESRENDTSIIIFNHPRNGHKLCFHDDLFQVGKLMKGLITRTDLSKQLHRSP